MRSLVTCVLVLGTMIGCGPSGHHNGDPTGDGGNSCLPEGAHRCSGASYQTCTGGMWQTAVDCPMACVDALGCVACTPGVTYCNGGDVWSCDDNGNPGQLVQQCTGVDTCSNGGCVDACLDAATNKSYIGCEYWAVDLDNAVEVLGQSAEPLITCAALYGLPTGAGATETLDVCFNANAHGLTPPYAGLCDPPATQGGAAQCPSGWTCTSKAVCVLDAQHSPFAIVVSNPQAHDATVTVTGPGNETFTQTVAAGQVVPIMPQMHAIPDESVDGSGQLKKAYKVTSDLPIVAYQFNPLDNSFVFSNDASLLIPRSAFDTDYYTMSWPTLDRRTPSPGTNPYYGYLSVVAWQDNTQISVTPTVAVNASATQQSIAAGATVTFTLNAFDVLQLQASAPAGDLTGTHIVSTNNTSFGVFGGHEAAAFGESTPPTGGTGTRPCCADHLEEMLFPSSTWGMSFAIARSQQRTNEPDYLRIMAQKPGTSVTFTPAPSTMVSGNCAALDVGQFCDVKIQGDTEITSTQPILVGHYLESSIWQKLGGGSIGNGDPSMAIAVPVEQYRTDYTVLIPSQYSMNYLSISASATGGVTVDGTAVTLNPFPGGGTHRSARVPVMAGQHTIHCADTCGVLVYGYSDAVSYMFAGGLDLKQIVIL